jgi:serine/threonine protein kinase
MGLIALYDVANGLTGMLRDILLRLCGLMWNKSFKIRMVLFFAFFSFCFADFPPAMYVMKNSDYEMQNKIGQGGFGRVFTALNKKTKKKLKLP